MELVGLRLPTSADEVRSGTQWFTYRNDKAREVLGWSPARTRRPSRTPCWQLEELGRRAEGHQLTDIGPAHRGHGPSRFPSADERGSPSPLPLRDTDQLPLPLRRVARRLNKLGLDYRTERVACRRSGRPEIVELTQLPYVPVLVDGDDNDSRRILQYLDWAYAGEVEGRIGDHYWECR